MVKESYWLQSMQSCIHWCKIRFYQKRMSVHNHTRNAMKQILSSTLENWPGTACYSWHGQKKEQRCCIWPFQPHTFPTSLYALSSPQLHCFSCSEEVSLTQKTTMRLILLQKFPRDVYSGESVQKDPDVGHCSPLSLLLVQLYSISRFIWPIINM